ncbi:MAG TPA: hypothetical protein VJ740_12200, partial [Hyphomicrobiaceae bacterium]|nr:hypothetical protein [Hyphomicrobiaceae bacterium]
MAALLAIDGYGHEARHADHAEPAVPPPEPAEPVAQVIPAPELTAPAGVAAEFAAQPLAPVEPVEAEAHSDEAGLPGHMGEAEPGAAAGALENGATDEPAGGVEAMVTVARDAAPQSQPLIEDGDLAPAALDSTGQPLLTYPDELPQPGAGEIAGVNEVGIAATAPASEALPGASPTLDDAASPTAVPAPPEQAEAATGQPEAPGGEKPDPEPAVSRPVPMPPLETVSHLIPEVQRAPVENAPALTPSVAPVLRPFAPEAAAPREAVSPVTPTPPPTYF